MSGAGSQDRSIPTDAGNIRASAAAWLLKRRDYEHWSDEDQVALDAWLAVSSAHMIAYIRLEAAWSQADRLAALRGSSNIEASGPPIRRISPKTARVAGVLAFACLLGAAIVVYFQRPTEKIYATQMGGHRIVMLADGSQVELNTDTVLRTEITENRKAVWLEKGEAYFQIKHNAAHPFIVMVGNQRVTDLGTRFLIRREVGKLEIAVMQGRVRFDIPANDHAPMRSTLLVSGNIAVATEKSVIVTKTPSQTLTNQLGWRHGVLVFENTTLADAAVEFNRYNSKKLIVADPEAARLTIGGTFPTNNVEDFTRLVQSVLGLRVERRGMGTVISR